MTKNMLKSTNLDLIQPSLIEKDGAEFGLARRGRERSLLIYAPAASPVLQRFQGDASSLLERILLVCPLNPRNAASLRQSLPWLNPAPLGLKTSAGMGDRLGLATAGHVRAVRSIGEHIAPIFVQQSIRENTRTGRNPMQVLDDATWGMFSEGWQGIHGADADHLKTPEDIDVCLAAGYTFFTIDPGAHVDNRAETCSLSELRQLADLLPADLREGGAVIFQRNFKIEHLVIEFDEPTLLKAAVKYGRAVEHVARMYHHLEKSANGRPFELEVSVDETDQPTSHAEHIYIAFMLQHLGVHWISLAPRYVGRFEKGVDYIGSLAEFESDFSGHAAISRHFGPYKLSLHSGSDKFSIYPIATRLTAGLVHLKTAGTSYLEALRSAAALDREFFREIYAFARNHYETDRASYHVSARLEYAPLPGEFSDWNALLDQFDAREILHVTFGSVLRHQLADGSRPFYDHLMELLQLNPEVYAENLKKHFIRHLQLFAGEQTIL